MKQVTPSGEFNTYADAVAAAQVFALTSSKPHSTHPPGGIINASGASSNLYPTTLSKPLKLSLFPLDITHQHNLNRAQFRNKAAPLLASGSPLAEWVDAFLTHTFNKMEQLHLGNDGDNSSFSLHDPLCVWYALTRSSPAWATSLNSPEDIRVETTGQWTRGMCVVDRRSRKRRETDDASNDDHGNWLSGRSGNRINRIVESPGKELFADVLLDQIFG
jgi:inosine-uridine nucleoside N-ribohydrolase